MSMVNTAGEQVRPDRNPLGSMDPPAMRAVAIAMFRSAGQSAGQIAVAMRCSERSIRRDVRAMVPDFRPLLDDAEVA